MPTNQQDATASVPSRTVEPRDSADPVAPSAAPVRERIRPSASRPQGATPGVAGPPLVPAALSVGTGSVPGTALPVPPPPPLGHASSPQSWGVEPVAAPVAPTPRSGPNPWIILLWCLTVALLGGGILGLTFVMDVALGRYSSQSFEESDYQNQIAYYQVLSVVTPALLTSGILGLIGLLVRLAVRRDVRVASAARSASATPNREIAA
ncbi:hypothetical protein D9V32_07015 [Mycetocola tolaasinivorans]|uniref:Uncharacterized protein n=1 Tax=Mycetocola tolaasinivorans TaxID=76635 RepID=A0A3L7A7W8_9MICO|nr:hypothetical protein D9V32_07015 [Mycetocola tolaasinivorans]